MNDGAIRLAGFSWVSSNFSQLSVNLSFVLFRIQSRGVDFFRLKYLRRMDITIFHSRFCAFVPVITWRRNIISMHTGTHTNHRPSSSFLVFSSLLYCDDTSKFLFSYFFFFFASLLYQFLFMNFYCYDFHALLLVACRQAEMSFFFFAFPSYFCCRCAANRRESYMCVERKKWT